MKPMLPIVCLLFLLSGCGTLLSIGMSHDEAQSYVYSGTRVDIGIPMARIGMIGSKSSAGRDHEDEKLPAWTWIYMLLLIDLPVSFVADTVLLPFTVTDYFRKRPTPQGGVPQ